ncbi:hypothetical protein N7534_011283 [Penicillium rubens]|nr:hypothetical protein N7534_011283 [Penicillium rubens]
MTSARSSRRARSQWPPAPCVEEEPQALSKELDGLSKLGAKPGVDGVHTRGVIDQYPILVSANSPPPPSTSPGSVPSVPGLGSVSSDESAGPTTPPAQEPILRNTVRFEMDDRPKRAPPSTASQPRGPPSRPLTQQQPTNELNTQRETQPPSHDRDSNFSRHRPPTQNTSHGPRGPSAPDRSGSRAPMHDKTYLQPPKSSIGRSNSARHAPSTTRPMPERFRREPSSGYLSDPATTYNRPPSHQPQAPVSTAPVSALPNGPTLAERIDEKLRQRQEQRDTGSMSDPEVRQIPTTMKHVKPNPLNIPLPPPPPAPAPAPAPRIAPTFAWASAWASACPDTTNTKRGAPSLTCSGDIGNDAPYAVDVWISPSLSTSTRGDQAYINPSGNPAKPRQVTGSSRILSTRRYITTAPQHGLTHLDICPSCMSQIAHSRYRDYFIPSLSKPAGQKTRCAFANAWTRLAWAQMIKKQHDSLELLYQMTRPPPGTRPCPGRIVAEQSWHRIYDPETGGDLAGFHVCSSCARNIRILMPSHRETFQLNPDLTERDPSRTRRPDTREFLNYARRKVVLRDCRRDRPTLSTWHFIPSLPEMCVCEDCYDEVVWPLARSKHPIACMVSTKMRILPGDGPGRTREASCQLYSPRMRAKFREAVARDDLGMLKSVAQRRVEAERRFLDRREELLVAQSKGYDCDEELRKAVDEWRRWE